MRLFVLSAALLFWVLALPAHAQEVPYQVRVIEYDGGPLVRMPVYRAPDYDTDTHVLAYVVSALGMPEADLPFIRSPGGVLVAREQVPEFRSRVLVPGETMLFVCTVPEAARASFDFARKESRTAHCVLNP